MSQACVHCFWLEGDQGFQARPQGSIFAGVAEEDPFNLGGLEEEEEAGDVKSLRKERKAEGNDPPDREQLRAKYEDRDNDRRKQKHRDRDRYAQKDIAIYANLLLPSHQVIWEIPFTRYI